MRLSWSGMQRMLVIGATGRVGREVISELVSTEVRVRALARDPDSANLPAPAEVVRGDLTIPASLDRSLDDVDSGVPGVVRSCDDGCSGDGEDSEACPASRLSLSSAPDCTPVFPAAEPGCDIARGNRAPD